MKAKIILLFLIFVFTARLMSQVNYYYYPVPSGTTNNLNEIIHRGYYYICGNNGVILRAQGLDSNWNMANSNTSVNLNSFMKPAESFFVAFGNNGIYLKTANGIDWVNYSINSPYNINAGVYTALSIFAIGDNGKILKKRLISLDTTWKIISSGTTNNLNSVSSYSYNVWIAGDYGLILYSNDTLHTLSTQVSGTTSNINKIVFRNASLGFAVGNNGLILRTTNGGINWIQRNSYTTANLNNIELENSDSWDSYPNLFISGNKIVLVSNDTGKTWIPDFNAPQYNLTSSFYFGKDYWGHTSNIYIGEGGKIFKRKIDTTYHTNEYAPLEANNIRSFFIYSGIFDQDLRTTNTAGFAWPKGSGHTAIFTAGLCIGAFVNGELREAMASYKGEYRPGYCVNGSYFVNDYFKIYKVNKSDNPQSNWDWANWGQMVPYGAPFIDVNNNHIYEPAIDTPGVRNAKETIFLCMTDANPQSHVSGEGFGGGTLPIGAEVHMTAWAYDSPGLQDVQFVSYEIINKSASVWNRVKMGIVSDPDLGDSNDDYIGCDTNLQLSYCYNADDYDPQYDIAPPAVGFTLLTGPLNRTVTPNLRLKMLTSAFVTKASSGGYPCETRPNGEPYAAYIFLSGYKKDTTSWLDPTFNPPKKTKFCYSGDPETNIGWTELKGHIANCNHDSTGTVIQPNASGDRRQFFSSGADNFNIIPGESQKFVIAQLIARGTSNLNSVTRLKQLCDSIRNFYNQNFPINVNNISSEVPKEFSLSQNYPNPFNPTTIIRFQIKDSRLVTLKVYDILGKEVTTLVNEKQSPGVYEVTFDASRFASGVYFYRLVAGESEASSGQVYTETKKMVLIK